MSCMRHSYPKGSIKGQRQCQRCKQWDTYPIPPAPFDLSEFLGTVEPAPIPAEPSQAPTPTEPPSSAAHAPALIEPAPIPEVGANDTSACTYSMADLPEHSKLGASSAERWMRCPGSVSLIQMLKGAPEEDPDYRNEGVLAHELAAHCLNADCDAWEAMGSFPGATQGIANAVQVYLDYVRSRPGRREVEVKMHRRDLDWDMYGTVDCKLVPMSGVDKLVLEIVDYKNGAGVFVSATKNVQMMYYAALEIYADPDWYPAEGEVRLTIVQPNCYSDEGVIRTWTTTVGAIREWVSVELLPAMTRAKSESYLSLGDWCRFCPAKLACPAMGERAAEMRKHAADLLVADKEHPLADLADEVLGRMFEDMQPVKMLNKAIEGEVYRRLMDRRKVPHTKLVLKRVDRVFKDGAEAQALTVFGAEAYAPQKLRSPAAMETLPGGKGFVAEWAYKPEAGYTVAVADDARTEVLPKSGEALHAQAVQKYLDNVAA